MPFCAVYGPVTSWRYGCSLGIDPVGPISTCSFNCVYCQLGDIEHQIAQRSIFVATAQVVSDLQSFAPWAVDTITLSGSGEPTLALNLGEVIEQVKSLTAQPVTVLTNGTLLGDANVQDDLASADQVAVKLDAVTAQQLQRINRPSPALAPDTLLQGIEQFRQNYPGHFALQTMLLAPWNELELDRYISAVQKLAPDEIQLNTPTRPKPLTHQLDGRGNHELQERPYPVQHLKSVSIDVLHALGEHLQQTLGIPVHHPPL